MNNNKPFETPEITICSIGVEDIITTSGGMEGYAPDTGDNYDFGQRT